MHPFLMPKLYVLRDYRANARARSYFHSSLWRYIEEALSEPIAQVGVNGFRERFVGIRFPVSNGHMYLRRGGGFDEIRHHAVQNARSGSARSAKDQRYSTCIKTALDFRLLGTTVALRTDFLRCASQAGA